MERYKRGKADPAVVGQNGKGQCEGMRPTRCAQTGVRALAVAALVAACIQAHAEAIRPTTTFSKHAVRAEAGDTDSQNLLGFMLFFGEGAPRNWHAARAWFVRAASNGSVLARHNLTMLDQLQPPDRPSPAAPKFRLRDSGPITPGERVYQTFCAGCHGLNGIAAYIDSPSFALGETLEKGEATLLRSVRDGTRTMAAWGDRLSEAEILAAVRFLHELKARYDHGISQALRSVPEKFFLFSVMRDNPAAFEIDEGDIYPR